VDLILDKRIKGQIDQVRREGGRGGRGGMGGWVGCLFHPLFASLFPREETKRKPSASTQISLAPFLPPLLQIDGYLLLRPEGGSSSAKHGALSRWADALHTVTGGGGGGGGGGRVSSRRAERRRERGFSGKLLPESLKLMSSPTLPFSLPPSLPTTGGYSSSSAPMPFGSTTALMS